VTRQDAYPAYLTDTTAPVSHSRHQSRI